MRDSVSEAELAAKVSKWLGSCGWDVYPEVTVSGGIADIVAVIGKPRRGWVIECKTSLSFDVLSQALRWRKYHAHYVSVAIPATARSRNVASPYARHCMLRDGIGLILVDMREYGDVNIVVPSPLNRRPATPITERVHEGHKQMGVAGTNISARWTPFKQTSLELQRFVERNPGCPLKQAIESINHHYTSAQSAKASLAHWIFEGKVPGVEIRHLDGTSRLYPNGVQGEGLRLQRPGTPRSPPGTR